MKKQAMIEALRRFINQRSGIEYGNYGERESFMGDYRTILRHGRHARALMRAVELRDSITAEDLLQASHAYSGRLQFVEHDGGKVSIEYTTGQYFPTEYRNAVCAVLASALWAYWRENMPSNDVAACPQACPNVAQGIVNCGEYVRKQARREFGRAIAKTWFN